MCFVFFVVSLSAWSPGRAQGGRAGAPEAVVQQVRTALGRGQATEARQLVASASPTAPGRDLARALVEIFHGRDEAARPLLEPLAKASPLGDAAVELGLLEIRRGRREEGWKILEPIVSNRDFRSEDDYFRLARAARASLEFFLSNDAFMRIEQSKRAEVHAEWGDLALQRHTEADALTSYKQALSLDPNWIPAQVGMIRAMGELADVPPPAVEAAFDTLRKTAPTHPDVLLLEAERALEDEDIEAAKRALDGVASVRTNSLEAAALRAAIAFDEGGRAAIDAPLAAIRAINPRSALGYRRIGEQAARRYRADDAAGFAVEAGKVDPDDPRAFLDIGLYLMRTGDEQEARVALERSWDLDKSNRLTKNLLDVLDKVDNYDIVTSGPFIFKFAKEETGALRPYALPLADEAYKTFMARYGFTPAGPLLVEMFPTHDDFAVRTVALPGIQGALGACFGRVITLVSPRAREPGEFSWQATLWHEIAHVFTLQATKFRVPRWLTEGISVYEEHRRRPAWGRELTLEFAHELSKGQTFGVKGLPAAFKRPESLALAYFEAALVVEHLVESNGDAGLRTLLQAYAEGATDTDAFAKAFGRSVAAVDASFKTFINERYGALARAMATPPEVAANDIAAIKARAAANPDSFISQLALGQALMKTNDIPAARGPLERAAKLAPPATGAGSPRVLLAEIAIKDGDLSRARRELRALLEHDHANVMAARQLVELAGSAPAGDASASADRDFGLRLVADLDPQDADVHGHLGRRLLEKSTRPDLEAALVEFRVALALGPANLAEAHADLADVLLRLGRREEAKTQALSALQLAPSFARAQDLLLAAIGRE